jgi:hypothetical protein
MPDGIVTWYDVTHDHGVVEHNGRKFAVVGANIESRAKRTGMPVHFDIRRTAAGDVATDVTARPGARTRHTSSRSGDLTGAHHASEKGQDEWDGLTRDRRAYGEQPRRLAEDWVSFLASGQIDRAAGLYAPDAVVRVGDRRISGAPNVRRWLEGSALHGADAVTAEVSGDTRGGFVVMWRPLAGDTAALRTALSVRDGLIVEQRTEEA